ncbi:MAG: spondin domain-containing protein [Candidatus Thiodiazotropha sp.]
MKKSLSAMTLSATLIFSANSLASDREISVEITNLTNGIYFTPLLVATHNRHTHLFELSTAASDNLQAMAEGGNIDGLVEDVTAAGGEVVADPASGLLAPGATAEAIIERPYKRNRYLSIVAMMLPTNDGFVGLDGLRLPKKKGTYTYYLHGYDAGTEANDEIINGAGAPGMLGIPADPGGNAGSGGVSTTLADHNQTVHIHRGNRGDNDPTGGESDLDAGVHTWQGPVARVVIHVNDDD